MTLTLGHYLTLGAMLFAIGVVGIFRPALKTEWGIQRGHNRLDAI